MEPVSGSTVASPNVPRGPEEPDYFFHWIRDAALFFEAVRCLWKSGDPSRDWPGRYRAYVRFSLSLLELTGQDLIDDPSYRARVLPDYRQFLRGEDELLGVTADTVSGDVRFNPNGTLDPIRWSRPQHDGPALRAINALNFWSDGETSDDAASLIRADLGYTLRHLLAPSIDLWEERLGRHFYTEAAQARALVLGAVWADEQGEDELSYQCREGAARAHQALEAYRQADGTTRASLAPETKTLDIANVLAALHAGPVDGAALATLEAFEGQCEADYKINHARRAGFGIALGRYRGDRYVTAGPWYLASFAAAELRYRLAAEAGDESARLALVQSGDDGLRAAAATIPASGDLSEQYDPATGLQSSARNLGWSHAAFITAAVARRAALSAGAASDLESKA